MARCKECGNELVKRRTKSGEEVLYCTECKKVYRLEDKSEEQEKKPKKVAKEEEEEESRSYFDGGLLQQIGWRFLGTLLTIVTLGIGFPWAICMLYNWETKHTVIEGKRLAFDGNGGQLLGNWIKWLLLTIITIGIYSFWIPIKVKKWITKHTYFVEEE